MRHIPTPDAAISERPAGDVFASSNGYLPSLITAAASSGDVAQRRHGCDKNTQALNVISLGAGVQSSMMAIAAGCRVWEELPMPDAAIFADTQNEPESVYKWLEWLTHKLRDAFPVIRVSKGMLSEGATKVHTSRKKQTKYTNSNIPVFLKKPGTDKEGLQSRQCTADYKIRPIQRECRNLIGKTKYLAWRRKHQGALKELALYEKWLKQWRRYKKANVSKLGPCPVRPEWAWNECQEDPLILMWIGISRDEAHRMKPSKEPWIKNIYPLVDHGVRRSDCLKWMEEMHMPEPPRSACVFCPYHGDAEWLRLKNEEPEEFAKAVAFEKRYQEALAQVTRINSVPFLHRSLMPISEIDFEKVIKEQKDEDAKQPDFFGSECEGMCGV